MLCLVAGRPSNGQHRGPTFCQDTCRLYSIQLGHGTHTNPTNYQGSTASFTVTLLHRKTSRHVGLHVKLMDIVVISHGVEENQGVSIICMFWGLDVDLSVYAVYNVYVYHQYTKLYPQ